MAKGKPLRLDHFLPYRLSVASNVVSDVIASAYRSLFALTTPQWRLVAMLGERGDMNQWALGVATRMDKVTVSRAAITLVERGLVKRSPHLEDKRSHLLALTPDGRALYDQVAPKALALEASLLADFDPHEIEHLAAMLLRLQEAATRLADPNPDPESPAPES